MSDRKPVPPAKGKTLSGRRNNGTVHIPERFNALLRERLRLLRLAKYRNLGDFSILASGTISRYENIDISCMKLGDVWHLGMELGYGPVDFLTSLLGALTGDNFNAVPEGGDRNEELSIRYLRTLNDDGKDLAVALLRALVEHYAASPRDAQEVHRLVAIRAGGGGRPRHDDDNAASIQSAD